MTERPPRSDVARMPVVFAGHGSPMNAIEDNQWSRGFRALGAGLPRPTAILAISAHWYTRATYLTDNPAPKTIHDFSGFPPALREVIYPARGHVDLAAHVREFIGSDRRRSAPTGGSTTAPGASCVGCTPRPTFP